MDFTLYALDAKTGARANLPHGAQARFKTEAEAVARANELRGEAAALGDTALPAYAVVDINGEIVREIRDADIQPAPAKKTYRVRWTEEYSQDVEAESAEQAEELRTDDNAFMGCTGITAQPLCEACKGDGCPTCAGTGSVPEAL